MEDRVLIRRIKKGDKAAFEELVVKHYENIFAYCFRRTGSRQDAEDLTQEVFLKLVKAVYKYQSTGKFSNFIFKSRSDESRSNHSPCTRLQIKWKCTNFKCSNLDQIRQPKFSATSKQQKENQISLNQITTNQIAIKCSKHSKPGK